jgi:Mg2+ and Co2+ transporter CorA
MVASSYPQFGWVAPQHLSSAHNSADVIATAVSAATPPDQQQLNAMSLDAVRQSIDRIAIGFAASQEQITRSVDRIAPSVATNQEQMTRSIERIAASQEEIARSVNRLVTGQEQMTREITKLQEIEQYHATSAAKEKPSTGTATQGDSAP